MLAHFARRSVVEIEPYGWEATDALIAARHRLPADTILRFDLNTVPSAPPSWHAAMTAARDEGGPQEYADPTYDELTRLLGGYLGVAPTQILVGAGADEILSIICQTFLDPGDAVVVTAPTYPVHTLRPQQLGATVRVCPLDTDFSPDPERLLAAAVGAKLLILCSPNNPTGNAFDPALIERIIAASPCPVVLDEAYAEFGDWSAIPLLDRHPHLIVVRTMSKAFALAGMRLGYAVAGSGAIDLLQRLRPTNSISVVTARIAAAGLRDLPAMRANVARVAAARGPLVAGLRAAGAHVYPSVTNFLLTDWGGPDAAGAVAARLERRGLVVRNYAHHQFLPGHLRITVRSAEQNARLLAALRAG
ncbi:MAG: Histidinol-phosphate aminotransferase [uncultured Thermomicrobiales bacterium]|uniref:Histidinol-phosphate aminotransferase n=1 Tax=uncultured Thermomicrobiales bacterium TaxID=1645740 RepID=A0A6J4VJA8_9BACT|nr:MAG: Histidinol-phosphate aminotransferase [uncultured Thermomicrobiales bacterium]